MVFNKAIAIKIKSVIFPLLVIYDNVLSHSGSWNNVSSLLVTSSTHIKLDCGSTNYAISCCFEEWGKAWVLKKHSVSI